MKRVTATGQALIEYALILFLMISMSLILAVLGSRTAGTYQQIVNAFATPATADATIQGIARKFMTATLDYFQKNGRWPPSWGDARFTALGFNPADWDAPVAGIRWNPNGEYIGLANVIGDKLQVYVRDTQGNRLHLYDGWNIWCQANSARCYYHTMGTGPEVDLNSIEIVKSP